MPARKKSTTARTNKKLRASTTKVKGAKKAFKAAGKNHTKSTLEWSAAIQKSNNAEKAYNKLRNTPNVSRSRLLAGQKKATALKKAKLSSSKKQLRDQRAYVKAKANLAKAIGREGY